MEQAIISLVGLGLALMIYLDRAHRAEVRAGFAQMDKRIDERFEQVDKRFEQVDNRFEQVDKRFEQVDKRFDQIDNRFDQIDNRFDQVDKRFDQVDKRIEFSAGRTDARINELNRSVIELAQGLGRVEGRTEVLTAVE